MTLWNIVVGQPIDAEKLQFARALRHKMTPAEAIIWASIRGRRLNDLKFRRQQIIDGYIADFFCSSAGLVIELDGAIHDAQDEYDTNRDVGAWIARDTNLECSDRNRVGGSVVGNRCDRYRLEFGWWRRPHPPAPSPQRRGGV